MARMDVTSYKDLLIRTIFNSETIVKLIDSQNVNYDPDSPDSLIHNNIFPYLRIPSTATKADSYVLFAVSYINQNRKNSLFMDVRVTARILAHQDRLKVKGKSGSRIDLIAKEVTKLLDNSSEYGCGTLELVSDVEDILNENYQYRDLNYNAVDLPKSICDL